MKRFAYRLWRKARGVRNRAWTALLLADLRTRGNRIHATVSLGERSSIDVLPGGAAEIGAGVRIENDSWLIAEDGDRLRIGDRVFISQHCVISGDVHIGDDTLIAGYVTIIDANHVFSDSGRPIREQGGEKISVRIGTDVWIGTMSVVLAGARIGDHAVIGAHSTVTGDIPAWAIAVGSPARVLRFREHG